LRAPGAWLDDMTALPTRDGVGPSCVALPAGPWPGVIDFLVARFPHVPATEWHARMAQGDVVDESGQRIGPASPYRPHGKLFYYRSLPPEKRRAVEDTVLFEDELLVAADKPHFLPVTPSGKYLQETLLVRLRRRLGIDTLTPLHRIDRETAGVVLFAKEPRTLKHYEALFAHRAVEKTYEAIAPWREDLRFPLVRQSVLEDGANFMQMREAVPHAGPPRPPNAHTTIELLQMRGALARYRLVPLTGKRHQLRVHMAALGLPIVGDRIYPVLQPEDSDDPANPLRLLAARIAFRDPLTGQSRDFPSRQTLSF
jgi:tRNA pseudouridine32 synthase/23S rRNA pseudouridine746 synthase